MLFEQILHVCGLCWSEIRYWQVSHELPCRGPSACQWPVLLETVRVLRAVFVLALHPAAVECAAAVRQEEEVLDAHAVDEEQQALRAPAFHAHALPPPPAVVRTRGELARFAPSLPLLLHASVQAVLEAEVRLDARADEGRQALRARAFDAHALLPPPAVVRTREAPARFAPSSPPHASVLPILFSVVAWKERTDDDELRA